MEICSVQLFHSLRWSPHYGCSYFVLVMFALWFRACTEVYQLLDLLAIE